MAKGGSRSVAGGTNKSSLKAAGYKPVPAKAAKLKTKQPKAAMKRAPVKGPTKITVI